MTRNEYHGVRASIEHPVFSTRINIAIVAETGGKSYMAEPVVMKEVPNWSTFIPTTTTDKTAAQQLIDDLWACGLRPSEGTGSAGAMAATQEHLKDMRKIALDLVQDLRHRETRIVSAEPIHFPETGHGKNRDKA